MRSRLIALAVLVGAATVIPASTALASIPKQTPTDTGSVGIRLVPIPGASTANPLANSYVVDRLAPGTTLTRSVEIDNNTSSVANVSVYAAAASVTRGTFGFAAGHSVNDLSSWTAVSQPALQLAANTKAPDIVTIRVPSSASEGEHYAVVWAQESAPSTTSGVKLINRVGVRMYLSIGPGGALPSNFHVDSLSAKRSASGGQMVVARVHNNGQNTLAIGGALTLSNGPDGLRAGPFAATPDAVLAPGATEPVTIHLSKALPSGPWRARLELSSGSLQRSTNATITLPGSGLPAKPATAALPTLLLVLALLLVLIASATLALLISRRRVPRSQNMRPGNHLDGGAKG